MARFLWCHIIQKEGTYSGVYKIQTWVNFGPEENLITLLRCKVSLSPTDYLCCPWHVLCQDINRKSVSCNLQHWYQTSKQSGKWCLIDPTAAPQAMGGTQEHARTLVRDIAVTPLFPSIYSAPLGAYFNNRSLHPLLLWLRAAPTHGATSGEWVLLVWMTAWSSFVLCFVLPS